MTKPIVLIAEQLSPATVEALGPDFEIRTCDGADREQLLAEIVDVDAVLVRSATKIDAEALTAAKRLTIVARAGVGLDNVDVKAATQAEASDPPARRSPTRRRYAPRSPRWHERRSSCGWSASRTRSGG